jgi:hypothetical protein
VQQCSGLRTTVKIRIAWSWFAVKGDAFTVEGAGPFAGWTSVQTHGVLLLSKYVMNERLVKHEMLHALMHEKNMKAGHGSGHFEKCGLQNQ